MKIRIKKRTPKPTGYKKWEKGQVIEVTDTYGKALIASKHGELIEDQPDVLKYLFDRSGFKEQE